MILQGSAITTTEVLAVVGTILQLIIVSLVTWLVRTTSDSKEKLSRFDVTLFGEKGNSGIVEEFGVFKERDEQMRRTLERVTYRLGAIEDKLKIPRNFNVGDFDTGMDLE